MLFILNKSYEVVGSLNYEGDLSRIVPYFDDEYVQDLATGAETFSFSTLANTKQAQHLVVGNFIAFRHESDFKLFNIISTDEEHTDTFIKSVYCEMASIELINKVVRPMNVLNSSLRKFMDNILAETEWQVGRYDIGLTDVHDFEIKEYKTVYSLIQEHAIGTFGAEISYRVEIKNGRVIGKYIDLYGQRSGYKGRRFSYTSDISSVSRTVDSSELCTALIPLGKNNTTIKSIETSDKPLNRDYIEDETAYKQWNVNGNHIFGIFKCDSESPHEILKLGREELAKRVNPKVKYELKVELLGKDVEIGETCQIVDHEFNPPLYLEGRISKLTISKTDPNRNECVLSNFREVKSNITDELRAIASELESYVDNKFPVGSDDIQNGAINGDKLQNGQIIQGTHLYANSVTAEKIKAGSIETDHLKAESVTADKVTTGELITLSAQIKDAVIDTVHIKEGAVDTIHINDGSITQAKIGNAQIGTAQIKDAEITVAKIQDAFIDNLVAKQGKFESAHIGVLTSDNIDANTINAEHIQASVIDAINMNVEGKITADRIDVSSLTVDEIDAEKITSGTIDADRINGSVISAINASIENATIDSAKIGELSADKITSGTISTDILKSNVISAINASIGKISADHIDVSSLTVDEIDAGKITSGTVDADRITGSVVQAINMSANKINATNINVNGLIVGSANIAEGSIGKTHIGKAQISNAHIDSTFIADAYIENLDASKITSGAIDTAKVTVSSVSGNLTISNNTIQVKDEKKVVRVQLGEDSTGDYGLIIQDANGNVMWDLTGATANGIQDSAVTTDKIKDESITPDKLVIDEIWADEGFITEFNAQDISASKITVGKITGEQLDIEGFIKFSHLDQDISENFVIPKDEDGNTLGTYINGSNIYTGTLHGDQIIANGFTAKDSLENVTFNIDKHSGEVTMSGEVKSMNYSDVVGSEQGYKLTPDGNAYLNNATIRGSVLLPSAGITDEGNVNLIPNTDFNIESNRSKYKTRGNNTSITWTKDSDGYYLTCRNSTLDVAEGGCGILTPQVVGGLIAGKEYTLSFRARSSSNTGTLDYIYIMSNETGVSNVKISSVTINAHNSWEKTQTITFKPTVDYPSASFLIGFSDDVITGNTNTKGFALRDLKLEEGSIATEFVPYGESVVRFWAGADYEGRKDAPFIVYADGSIKATEGEFGGVFSGKVNIGNIHIEDTNASEGSIEIKDNTDTNTLIRFNEKESYFKNDLSIGTDFVNFDSSSKILENKGKLNLVNSKYSTYLNNGAYIIDSQNNLHSSRHIQRYSESAYVFQALDNKTREEDYIFYREDGAVQVDVWGNMFVRDKITMNNNIAIVARQDTGNSGFDFVVN